MSVSLMFLPYFDVFCDLLLNRPTATWNLFVVYNVQKTKLKTTNLPTRPVPRQFRHFRSNKRYFSSLLLLLFFIFIVYRTCMHISWFNTSIPRMLTYILAKPLYTVYKVLQTKNSLRALPLSPAKIIFYFLHISVNA